MYYDKSGAPIPREVWAQFLEDDNYRIIKQDTFTDGSLLSTVWIGLHHSFGQDTGPMIFETMYFPQAARGDYLDDLCIRYSSAEAALKGHQEVFDQLVEGFGVSEDLDDYEIHRFSNLLDDSDDS